MNNIKIKLCGLSRPADIEAANELKPEYIGYIFAPGRKRTIEASVAKGLTEKLNDNIIPVGVFKNNPLEEITEIANNGIISMIQLHGREDDDFILKVKEATRLPVIKAFGIAWEDDIKSANESPADYVLLDTPGGGTGFEFDHSLISKIKRDYFLAGGLDPETVAEVVENIEGRKPFAVDVSSGIETEGAKDSKKMEAFVKAVRQ